MQREKLSDKVKRWAVDKVRYHMTDMSRVAPQYNTVGNTIWLNSCAGSIRFVTRDMKEFCHFRDNYLNLFANIKPGLETANRAYFNLYIGILNHAWSKKTRVRYKGNLRTRLRMRQCRLN